jgi:hypothetical protein
LKQQAGALQAGIQGEHQQATLQGRLQLRQWAEAWIEHQAAGIEGLKAGVIGEQIGEHDLARQWAVLIQPAEAFGEVKVRLMQAQQAKAVVNRFQQQGAPVLHR